jgi:hypothetical protein
MHIFARIMKAEPQPDGHMRIWGTASSEERDSDGEIVLSSAIADAIPEYVRFGNTGPLREMHGPTASGLIDSIYVDGDRKTQVSGIVVDEGTKAKLRAGVLKGLSIGGRATSRDPQDPRVITACSINEI